MNSSLSNEPYTPEDLMLLAYFQREKGDMTRYVDFDRNRLRISAPALYAAYMAFETAKRLLDFELREIENVTGAFSAT